MGDGGRGAERVISSNRVESSRPQLPQRELLISARVFIISSQRAHLLPLLQERCPVRHPPLRRRKLTASRLSSPLLPLALRRPKHHETYPRNPRYILSLSSGLIWILRGSGIPARRGSPSVVKDGLVPLLNCSFSLFFSPWLHLLSSFFLLSSNENPAQAESKARLPSPTADLAFRARTPPPFLPSPPYRPSPPLLLFRLSAYRSISLGQRSSYTLSKQRNPPLLVSSTGPPPFQIVLNLNATSSPPPLLPHPLQHQPSTSFTAHSLARSAWTLPQS